jgi:ribosomal protein S18 acetylase RimI-like enzyme
MRRFMPTADQSGGIYQPGAKDIPRLVKVAVDAFFDYPIHAWTFPDEHDRRARLPAYFTMLERYGLFYGEEQATSPACDAFAIYLLPGTGEMNAWRWIRAGYLKQARAYGKAALRRYDAATANMAGIEARNAPGPHAYLMLLAVDPRAQHKGLATALVKTMLGRLVTAHLGCYLETHDLANEAFYNRLGFATAGKYPVPGTPLTLLSLAWVPGS